MGQEDLQRVWRTSNRREDLQWIWRTPSQGLEDIYGAGGPPTGLEDLRWVWRTSNRREDLRWVWRTSSGSGGPPTGGRTSNGSGGPQVRFYGAGGPPTGLEDLEWIWRTSNRREDLPMGLEDLQQPWRTPSQDQWGRRSSNTPLTTPLSLSLPPYSLPCTTRTACTPGGAGPPRLLLHPEPGSMGQEVLQHPSNNTLLSLSPHTVCHAPPVPPVPPEVQVLHASSCTPSRVLWGRRTSKVAGGPPMGLEDPKSGSRGHLWGWRTSNSPRSPPTPL